MLSNPANGQRPIDRDRRWDNSWWSRHNSWIHKLSLEPTECTRRRFFRWRDEYRTHSGQLIAAIQQWALRVRFTSCEYNDGRLIVNYGNISPNESDIQFIQYAMRHLQRSYIDTYNLAREIEDRCRNRCGIITEIMEAQYKPSFQKEIINKLSVSCPRLARAENITHQDVDRYFARNVFRMLFEMITRNISTLPLSKSEQGPNTWHLLYNGTFLLMRGPKSQIDELERALNALVVDNEIREFVNKYQIAKAERNAEESILANRIQDLRTLVEGGQPLNTPGDCDLCPREPS
jgi:hypothetical protein